MNEVRRSSERLVTSSQSLNHDLEGSGEHLIIIPPF